MGSLTEMAVFAPVSGTLSHHSESELTQNNDDWRANNVLAGRWVDPALGFAVSIWYEYWLSVNSHLIRFRLAG